MLPARYDDDDDLQLIKEEITFYINCSLSTLYLLSGHVSNSLQKRGIKVENNTLHIRTLPDTSNYV